MRDLRYLRLGIRDFKRKSGRDSGLKVCAGGGMPKVTLGITGLPENLGRDYGIEKPYWGSSNNAFIKRKKIDGMQRSTQRVNKTDWFLCRISHIKEML